MFSLRTDSVISELITQLQSTPMVKAWLLGRGHTAWLTQATWGIQDQAFIYHTDQGKWADSADAQSQPAVQESHKCKDAVECCLSALAACSLTHRLHELPMPPSYPLPLDCQLCGLTLRPFNAPWIIWGLGQSCKLMT